MLTLVCWPMRNHNYNTHFLSSSASVASMSESFQDAFHPIIKISQFFGIFPISFAHDKITFKWISAKTFYSLLFLACAIIECTLSFRVAFKGGISLWGSSSFSYMFVATAGCMFLLRIARKWPCLMEQWQKSEKVIIIDSAYCIEGMSLKRKIWFWASIMGLLAFCE